MSIFELGIVFKCHTRETEKERNNALDMAVQYTSTDCLGSVRSKWRIGSVKLTVMNVEKRKRAWRGAWLQCVPPESYPLKPPLKTQSTVKMCNPWM